MRAGTVRSMPQALRIFGRILARHWPALVAWYLAGEALQQLLVQLAGFVGGHTTLGGLLLLPLAVAARLASYVAMYLTVRPSLPSTANGIHDGPREFARAILAAILPFFAFYAAWGMLAADQNEFFNIASAIALRDAGYDAAQLGDRGGIVSVGVLPVAVLLIALGARVVLARMRQRLPEWTLALAAYAEVLWTFMLFTLVGQWWGDMREWISERAAASWLQGIGDWFAASVAPVAFVWEGALWLIGIAAAVLLVPAAWLTVAGVIYGTAFDSAPPTLGRGLAALRGTAVTLTRTLLLRLESLWAAVAVIWRGGPLLFGMFVLAYALWGLAEQTGTRGLMQLIGGQETSFWSAYLPLLLVAVAAVAEPLRVALVATVYDAVIARPDAGLDIRHDELDDRDSGLARVHSECASGLDDEASGLVVGSRDVEVEGSDGIVRNEEDRQDAVGP